MLTLASGLMCHCLIQGDRMCAGQGNNKGNKLEYNDNNELSSTNTKEVIITQQEQGNECIQQQQKQLQQQDQEIRGYELPVRSPELKIEVEAAKSKEEHHQQQQRIKRSNIFDPFDFANLRQLHQRQQQHQQQQQQIVSTNNKNYNDYNQQNQQPWQLQRLQPVMPHSRRYKNNGDNSNNNNNNGMLNKHNYNNNNGRAYSQIANNNNDDYAYYLYANNNNKNTNHNNNDINNNNNDDNADYDEATKQSRATGYGFGNRVAKNGDWLKTLTATTTTKAAGSVKSPTQQDANMDDFRLQLSVRNEPVSDNGNNNNNSYNKKSQRISNNKGSADTAAANNNNNNGDDDDYSDGIESQRNSRIDTSPFRNGATHDAADDATKADDNNNNNNSNGAKITNGDTTNSHSNDSNVGQHKIKTRAGQRTFNNIYHNAGGDFVELNNNGNNDEELAMDLPYGIQNVRKRNVRENIELQTSGISTIYQSLCPTKRVTIPLETSGFEYRPNQYIEVTCAHNYSPSHTYNQNNNKNKICSEAGFSCIQLNRTIHLIRRSKALKIDCWESEIRIVPSGCECMWPKHSNGDIITYHNTQKRFEPAANEQLVADYVPGEGYLEWPRQIELVSLDGSRRGMMSNDDGYGYDGYTIN